MTDKEQELTKQERKDLAYKEYLEIAEPAWKEYSKIKEPARKEYEKIIEPAWEEYEKKCKEIDNEK